MLGVDIVQVSRMEDLQKHDQFLEKVFTERERLSMREESVHLAGRFAAKEACVKALGTGFGPVDFQELEILQEESGKPVVVLSGRAQARLEALGYGAVELSISHEKDYAVAVCLLTEAKAVLQVPKELRGLLPARDRDTHKGNYGKVAILGGSQGMSGSVVMSSRAAIRTGSGLVMAIVPDCIFQEVSAKSLEVIVKKGASLDGGFDGVQEYPFWRDLKGYDALAIGPGLGRTPGAESFLRRVLTEYPGRKVVDADGLNLLAKDLSSYDLSSCILTPHEQEMARLMKTEAEEVHALRKEHALKLAQKTGAVVVLKGMRTLVTDGQKVYYNESGNPGMATAGSGDVLTGIICSLLGRGLSRFDAASLGVFIHGAAGDFFANKRGEDGLIAGDLIDSLPDVLKLLQECNDGKAE